LHVAQAGIRLQRAQEGFVYAVQCKVLGIFYHILVSNSIEIRYFCRKSKEIIMQ
jgi:hypothetical protein